MTTILLIRHGENDYVKTGKLAGRLPNVHLNARGKLQADALAEILKPVRLRVIVSSPLERAMETAAPLAASKKMEIIVRENLSEIKYGQWQGASLKRLQRRKLWRIIQTIPSLARFPQGESFPEAQARIVSELETPSMEHPKRLSPAFSILTPSNSPSPITLVCRSIFSNALPLPRLPSAFSRSTMETRAFSV